MANRSHKQGYLGCSPVLREVILSTQFGAVATKEKTCFTSFITEADAVKLEIFDHLEDQNPLIIQLEGSGPIYSQTITGDLQGKYYQYRIKRSGKWLVVQDPWALSMTKNSEKAMICDHQRLKPEGFDNHNRPQALSRTESILYETHIIDTTVKETSHQYKGKYLGLSERGTVNSKGEKTGLDHLVELGITHLHILPLHDMGSVDEVKGGYNWGYDPMYYLCPEGVYATNPVDGRVRVLEMKQMVKAIHEAGLHVVLDVVYNHTYVHETHPFELMAPGWYFRKNKDNSFSNGSGCGNETASESPIFQRLVLDSLSVYLKDYQVDGFRFDLLALHDTDFVKRMEAHVKAINPSAILYGEPWMGGKSTLSRSKQFRQGSQKGMAFAVFNDHIRNAIKGDNDGVKKGFVSGGQRKELEILKGIVGGIAYDETINDYCFRAGEAVNYVSCHDNLCLLDKLTQVHPNEAMAVLAKRNLMALNIVLWSFGTPFIQGGTELLRTKYGDHNSFISGDDINGIQWDRKSEYLGHFKAVKASIALRKSIALLKEEDPEIIKRCFKPLYNHGSLIAYSIAAGGEHYYFAHNAGQKPVTVKEVLDIDAECLDLLYDSEAFLQEGEYIENSHWLTSLNSKVWLVKKDRKI